jgi:hypothetical protein
LLIAFYRYADGPRFADGKFAGKRQIVRKPTSVAGLPVDPRNPAEVSAQTFDPANMSSRKRAATGFSYRVPAPPVKRTAAFLRAGASPLGLAMRGISGLVVRLVQMSSAINR